VLFGSRAIWSFKKASDMDIALFGDKVTNRIASRMKFDIEEDSYLPFFLILYLIHRYK
jgi:predicted nucleotidyltransferase